VPQTYTDERKLSILNAFIDYVDTNERPIIKEFCVNNNVPSNTFRDWAKNFDKGIEDKEIGFRTFATEIRKSIDKLEVYYQTKGATGRNVAFYIFALKCVAQWKETIAETPQNAPTIHVHNYSDMNPNQLEGGIQDRLLRLKENNTAKKGKKSA
jgi:hypothetical protein